MRSLNQSAEPNELRDARSIAWPVAFAGCAIAAVAVLLRQLLPLDELYPLRVLVLSLFGGAMLFVLAAKYQLAESFGAANTVTLARGALAMLLFGLLGGGTHAAVAWLIVIIAVFGLILDGVDGSLARRRGEASAFGARFDMEADALLILAMTVLAWQFDKAGAWIVLGGALRYLFVAASYGFAWLRRELPSSRRRQTICVIQIVSLVVCLVPWVARPLSSSVALIGLLLLSGSFAVDVVWLAGRQAGMDARVPDTGKR
jgi:phosphatidylglycerophosphate synthase